MLTPQVHELPRPLEPTTPDTFLVTVSADADAELATLVRAAAAGDDAAWSRLVGRFDRRLRSIATSYKLMPADVDDVVQATWIRLFRTIERLREPAAIAGWLTITARRESLRLLQRPVREVLTDDGGLGDGPDPEDPARMVFAAERRATLDGALGALPERHRRLMTMLADDAAGDYDDISATLGIPRGSIGPIRARCIARLRDHPAVRELQQAAL